MGNGVAAPSWLLKWFGLIARRPNRFINNSIDRFAMNWFREPLATMPPEFPRLERWLLTWEYRDSQ
jgi:hypothetical protein